jgi:hypothetical protein
MSSEEDGDNMFLRNVGIDLQIHTVPKPKTSQLHDNIRRENLKSHLYVSCF